ncbi:hypothetical protein Syun_014728 [Stephania yunnanensis]|uniref:Uncharacterized protein n=1 Tax=Stephania yunnanensis TaxID=152371 RepID=A0AAP0P8T2_9MAGN
MTTSARHAPPLHQPPPPPVPTPSSPPTPPWRDFLQLPLSPHRPLPRSLCFVLCTDQLPSSASFNSLFVACTDLKIFSIFLTLYQLPPLISLLPSSSLSSASTASPPLSVSTPSSSTSSLSTLTASLFSVYLRCQVHYLLRPPLSLRCCLPSFALRPTVATFPSAFSTGSADAPLNHPDLSR